MEKIVKIVLVVVAEANIYTMYSTKGIYIQEYFMYKQLYAGGWNRSIVSELSSDII